MQEIPQILYHSHVTILSFKSLAVYLRNIKFINQKFYMALALRWVFCTDLRIDRDFCFLHH